MERPVNPGNRDLLSRLRDMWERRDPHPAGLTEQILVGLAIDNLDDEVMALQPVAAMAGARGPRVGDRYTFELRGLGMTVLQGAVMVVPSGRQYRRVDGWIAPAVVLGVHLHLETGIRTTTTDHDGRFSFDDLPTGAAHLSFEPVEGSSLPLTRPVVTAPITL